VARFTGYHMDGGYAEFVVALESFAHALPAGFSPAQAAPLLCAGVIGFRALRQSTIRPGGRLGLYGFGGSAHIAIQVAVHWGCEVFVFTRSEEHGALARELGAHWTGRAEDDPPGRLDSAIIFAPVGRLVLEALRVLAKGGTIAIAGITMSPMPELDYSLLYQERSVRSVANSTRQDVIDLLTLASEIPIRTEVQMFPLEQANHALHLLKESRFRGAAVLRIS
jgi:propanol-preferring alcohol dehydrogenase